MNGAMVRQHAIFSADDADRYVHDIRFPVAVRLDRPYRYRVSEFFFDGREELVTDWAIRSSWAALIDVTHLVETRPTSNWLEHDDLGAQDTEDTGEQQ